MQTLPSALSPDLVDPSQLPLRFGRYQLTALLGEGGMGRVFAARLEGPEGFRKRLAVKVVRTRVAAQEGVRAAIVAEARIGGLLSHPHLVDVYDFGIEGEQPFIAMELVEGESLAERLARGPMRGAELLDLLIALTRGLVHLHDLRIDGESAGLVHRDLKPGNVLLGQDGRIKITDFGLARASDGPDAVTWSDAVRGTPAYMSPEQARGVPLDARSDLFALGAIGFEAATGERLLQGGGLLEVMSSLMRIEDRLEDLPSVDRVLPGLAPILQTCLRDDREKRAPRAAALLDALLALRRLPHQDSAPTLAAAPRMPSSHPGLADLEGVFVGRTRELAAARELLDGGARLLSVVGAGGAGKTRLARRLAMDLQEGFAGGVVFADLTTASSVDGVCHAIGTALQLGLDPSDPVGMLAQALAGRGRVLLLLDNFEQVAAHAGDTINRWLAEAPELVVLVTTRVRLRLAAERVLALGPLPTAVTVPRGGEGHIDLAAVLAVPAAELFVARAQEANPSFALRDDNAADVLALVEALEGIPLAIELAAARARVLSPRRILERLPRRFDLLSSGRADVTARQATLRATVDWSWDLLEPWEQCALACLSVFRGGFSLESAEEVLDLSDWPEAPWVMDVVQALADKSLLRVFEPPGMPGETRFAPYETIREYATEKLALDGGVTARGRSVTGPDAVARVEASHGRWFAQLPPPAAAPAAFGRWRRQQALELDNLLVAAERAAARGDEGILAGAGLRALEHMLSAGPYEAAVEHARRWRAGVRGPALGIELGIAFARALVWRRGLSEALSLLEQLQADADALGDPALRCDLRVYRARLVLGSAGGEVGIECALDARTLAEELGDRGRLGAALSALGTLYASLGRTAEARIALEEARGLMRRVGDHEGEVRALVNLAIVYKELGQDMLLEGTLQEALRRAKEVGFTRAMTKIWLNLAVRWQETGRLREALSGYREGLELLRRTGDQSSPPIFLANIGDVHRELGELQEALAATTEATGRGAVGIDERQRAGLLFMHADVLFDLGRIEEAEATARAALGLSEEAGAIIYRIEGFRRLGAMALRQGKGEEAEQALEQARALLPESGLSARAARVMGVSAACRREAGDLVGAARFLEEAEVHARGCDDRIYEGMLACERSALAEAQGEIEGARAAVSAARGVLSEFDLPPDSELGRAITAAARRLEAEPASP